METLSQSDYESLRESATVTASDDHGDKVLKLADGSYLKLFRIKRLITSARFFPYWRRFAENAGKLSAVRIPTLSVIRILDIPHLKRTAVHYDPLPGQTLRELRELDRELVSRLGEFLCLLHDKGVYLRSLHLGNVVLTPDGDLGLIDVADMRIRSSALSDRLRVRNFYHLCRYEEDRRLLAPHEEAFLSPINANIRPKIAAMLAG